MPDVTQAEIGRRMYHVHREKRVEQTMKLMQQGIGPDWRSFTENEILLLGHLLQCAWNTIDQKQGHVKAGIREVLDTLEGREDIRLGLLTGNIEQGAMLKLKTFGLERYFDIGAFGDDDADRNKLLPIAVNKLRERKSLTVSFRDCMVIGDTPRDVECSRPYGAFSVAVATGPYPLNVLSEAGADVLFKDLSDTEGFLNVLNNYTSYRMS